MTNQPPHTPPSSASPSSPSESGGAVYRRRSAAWVFYALITLGAFFGLFQGSLGSRLGCLVILPLAALYTRYLYRGGDVVLLPLPVWLWLPLAAVGLFAQRRNQAKGRALGGDEGRLH